MREPEQERCEGWPPTAPWLPVKMCSRKPMMRAWTVLNTSLMRVALRFEATDLRSQPGGWKWRSTKGTLQAWARAVAHVKDLGRGGPGPPRRRHPCSHPSSADSGPAQSLGLFSSTMFHTSQRRSSLQAGSEVLLAGFRPFPEFSRMVDEGPALRARVDRLVATPPAPKHHTRTSCWPQDASCQGTLTMFSSDWPFT